VRTSPFDPEMSDSSQNRDIVALKKGLTFQFGLQKGSLPAWAETFLKGSGSSMELEPGPEDALIVVLRCSRNEIVNL